jgi:hypothetical protein
LQDQTDTQQHFYQEEECSNPVETDELSNSVLDRNCFPESNTSSEHVQVNLTPKDQHYSSSVQYL